LLATAIAKYEKAKRICYTQGGISRQYISDTYLKLVMKREKQAD